MPSSAEGKFARKLASNEAKVRNRALSRLKMYLTIRSKNDGSKHCVHARDTCARAPTCLCIASIDCMFLCSDFDHVEMLKLWKGLYFCMWMADKPLVQVCDVCCMHA